MMDTAHPEESMAVLDGEPVKKGTLHHGYQVIEVLPDRVRVFNEQTREEQILKIGVQPVVVVAPEKLPAPLALPTALLNPQPLYGNLMERLQKKMKVAQDNLSVTKWVNKVYEMRAAVDLARIYNAAVNYSNKNKKLAKDLKELITANYLPKSFEQPVRSEYIFYLNSLIQPFGVHADPAKKDSGLRYFFVGQDAVIRVETGKPAAEKSPPHDY